MRISFQEAERLMRESAAALQQGRPADARRHLERLTAAGIANVQILMMLAGACGALGDSVAEERALDALLALDPKVVRALIMKGDCRAAVGDTSGAIAAFKMAVKSAKGQDVPAALAPELKRAEAMVAKLTDSFAAEIDAKLARNGLRPGPRSPRFQQSLDVHTGRKEPYAPDPTFYLFPGLPGIQFFDREAFDWVPEVEAHTGAILEELQAAQAEGIEDYRPYMHSGLHGGLSGNARLIDSYDWSALFLIENGRRSDANIARFPRTWQAVQAAPQPWVQGSFPTIMFSLLKPGARIEPHTGMMNTRLTCHLPLVVPPGCAFRVGNEVREWEVGKLLIFDDTIEHEAWNEGEADRIVLIFDIWRPELSEQERQEVSALLRIAGPGEGAGNALEIEAIGS